MPSPKLPTQCAWCGQQWQTSSRNARTCSPKCRAQLREQEHGPTKGREPRNYPAATVEQIRRLYESGMTRAEVQSAIGPGVKVENVMRRHDIHARPAISRDQTGSRNACWKGDAANYQALNQTSKKVQEAAA